VISAVAQPITNGRAFTIADGTGTRGAGGKLLVDASGDSPLAGAFHRTVQREDYFRGTEPDLIDRLNASGEITLVAEYEFSTEAECFLFVLGLDQAVPVECSIILRASNAQRVLRNAAITDIAYQGIGEVAVRVSYRIEHGLTSTSIPKGT
jgi:hypothetical protein